MPVLKLSRRTVYITLNLHHNRGQRLDSAVFSSGLPLNSLVIMKYSLVTVTKEL